MDFANVFIQVLDQETFCDLCQIENPSEVFILPHLLNTWNKEGKALMQSAFDLMLGEKAKLGYWIKPHPLSNGNREILQKDRIRIAFTDNDFDWVEWANTVLEEYRAKVNENMQTIQSPNVGAEPIGLIHYNGMFIYRNQLRYHSIRIIGLLERLYPSGILYLMQGYRFVHDSYEAQYLAQRPNQLAIIQEIRRNKEIREKENARLLKFIEWSKTDDDATLFAKIWDEVEVEYLIKAYNS